MHVFDLHCDTLTRCVKFGEDLAHATGHVGLARSKCFGAWAQVFAVFVPDSLRGSAAADYCDECIDFYRSQLRDITRVCRSVLAIENGNALMGDLRRLDVLAQKQVKLITLTWNGENELGYGAGCCPAAGLKAFGVRAVKRMFELNIHPDVSHLNRAGFWQVARLGKQAGRPLVATHSCCAAVQPHCRNLTDEQLRAIFASGGLVGLCLYPEFLGGAGDAQAVAQHLEHLRKLGGEDHIALGSDFDGCTLHASLAGMEHLPNLNADLGRMGFSKALLEKFFWSNAARFFA